MKEIKINEEFNVKVGQEMCVCYLNADGHLMIVRREKVA